MAEENKIFTVEIITPDRIFYKGEGDMIEFTTAVGMRSLTIRRAAIISLLSIW